MLSFLIHLSSLPFFPSLKLYDVHKSLESKTLCLLHLSIECTKLTSLPLYVWPDWAISESSWRQFFLEIQSKFLFCLWGYFELITYSLVNLLWLLVGQLWKHLGYLYSNIWSHCLSPISSDFSNESPINLSLPVHTSFFSCTLSKLNYLSFLT